MIICFIQKKYYRWYYNYCISEIWSVLLVIYNKKKSSSFFSTISSQWQLRRIYVINTSVTTKWIIALGVIWEIYLSRRQINVFLIFFFRLDYLSFPHEMTFVFRQCHQLIRHGPWRYMINDVSCL